MTMGMRGDDMRVVPNLSIICLGLDVDGSAIGCRMGPGARFDTTCVVKQSRQVVSKRKCDHGEWEEDS